jgi:hypothetical protein
MRPRQGTDRRRRPFRHPMKQGIATRDAGDDRYLAMGLLIATELSSLVGFDEEASELAAAAGQTAFLLFGVAFLLVLGRLWFWPENRDRE